MTRSAALLVLLLGVTAGSPAAAQSLLPVPISVEGRIGVAVPTGDFATANPGVQAEPGPTLGALLGVHLTRSIALLGGYSRTTYGCPRCSQQGLEGTVLDEGGEVGLQLAPAQFGALETWIRAAGVYRQITFSGSRGDLFSDPAFGFQVGAGVALGLPAGLRLSPGVHFRSFPAELDLGGLGQESVDVSTVLLDVGLSFRF